MSQPFKLPLGAPVVALPVTQGTPIVLHGSVVSRFDAVELDAATTRWPSSAPGGASLDARGLIDFEAGGLELTALDADDHTAVAVAKPGAVAPLCARHGTTTPCLVLRTGELAHARLLTEQQWLDSLRGGVSVEIREASVAGAAESSVARSLGTALQAASVSFASFLLLGLLLALGVRLRRAREPARRLARLVRSVHEAAAAADPILAELLAPALAGAARAVRRRRIDPSSAEGRRLESALEELRAGLHDRASHRQAAAERRIVDELGLELEVALDAATEASSCS
jgi:hypothetical protein